ncbi:MAG: hypothetical protein LJE68_05390 [Rhodobacter sp.]|jgi:predicted membrane channel-forming protein YqfA (hemolysin III family)|nr:hypothetical protein [Rhodobacter sp.]
MKKLLMLLLLCWAIAFFGSFAALLLLPTVDNGLTAGLNRVTTFFTWQLVAVGLAMACMVLRWSSSNMRLRSLAAVPAIVAGLMAVVVGGMYVWGNMQHPMTEASGLPAQSERSADG